MNLKISAADLARIEVRQFQRREVSAVFAVSSAVLDLVTMRSSGWYIDKNDSHQG